MTSDPLEPLKELARLIEKWQGTDYRHPCVDTYRFCAQQVKSLLPALEAAFAESEEVCDRQQTYINKLEAEIAVLKEHERLTVAAALAPLIEASKNLLEECYQADAREELTVDGSFLDAMRDALIAAPADQKALDAHDAEVAIRTLEYMLRPLTSGPYCRHDSRQLVEHRIEELRALKRGSK